MSQHYDQKPSRAVRTFPSFSFAKRVTDYIGTVLPRLLTDTVEALNEIEVANPSRSMLPFEVIYNLVFRLTVRTVGCVEFADDPKILHTMRRHFERMEESFTPASITTPTWFITLGRLKRLYSGIALHMQVRNVVRQRRRDPGRHRHHDTLQLLIDQGDSEKAITRFIISAIFAGQSNTGIAAAYTICYLATNEVWMAKVRSEIEAVANAGDCGDIEDALLKLPVSEWLERFPVIDLCIRETIRLTLIGCAFRRNVSAQAIVLGSEDHGGRTQVVPPGWYAAYHLNDVHRDENIYRDPEEWDPSRYLEGREEHLKAPLGYVGWGHGRHACLGKRVSIPPPSSQP